MPGKPKKPSSGNRVTIKATGRGKSPKAASSAIYRSDVLDAIAEDGDTVGRGKNLLKHPDTVDLNEEELKEEITRVLNVTNTTIPDNLVIFSHKEKKFEAVPSPGNHLQLMHYEGDYYHKNSREGRAQLKRDGAFLKPDVAYGGVEEGNGEKLDDDAMEEDEGVEVDGEESPPKTEETKEEEKGEDQEDKGEEKDEEEQEEETANAEVEGDAQAKTSDGSIMLNLPPKKLTNQFNFCERAALTYNNPQRDLATQTVPPPRANIARLVTQWTIFDAYEEDFAHQQRLKELEKKKEKTTTGGTPWSGPPVTSKASESSHDTLTSRMLRAAKRLERMLNQNIYEEISHDFKYWEDPSDEYREEEGTLLPLWKFSYDRTRKMNVTALSWNPEYKDLFAVGYGSFDFSKQPAEGSVCLFSLKNTSHPEYVAWLWTGVCSIDFHPQGQPYLIAVGLVDGNVAVYSIQKAPPHVLDKPLYRSDSVANKHAKAVWQVRWGSNMPDGEIPFYSVSLDGSVFCWIVANNELNRTLVITLSLPIDPIPGPDSVTIPLTACGTAFAFHPTEHNIFLVGTEEGRIYKCSTAYASLYLSTWDAHHMPVHCIGYNPFNPSIFLSCGGDWRVKIWEDNRSEPLFVFDVGSPIGDAAWAPYSSTSFAAVSWDGRAHVFDLSINKYHSICSQALVQRRRSRLTTVAFNHKHPIIIVGDDRGIVTSLKLSPNLRKKPKPPKKGQVYDPMQLEVTKLEKLLSLVREPSILSPAPDVISTTS
ncbi:dynein intermediate chain 2, ciliary [Ischnura elegans]|uniref:dynein intermediate chain 2, ciliary n=1 Tax=Ischnura elegans TaxID=197161 RepID=UPI001ED8914F|nr:dynein intermediate chain 2, ciliary [Ischnura elegans]